MTSPPAGSGDAAGAGDDAAPRVKFLCSFGGTILPRPLDSRLRYVGGETRIVSVPRHASFSDLLARLRLLFDSPTPLTIKYQQPDEDLDALVSVVNHDDVLNLMDEYDKLGADAFTRLRIFLFSSHDPLPPFPPADDRDSDRRYIDALNDSPPSPDFHRPFSPAAYFSPAPSPRYDYPDYLDNVAFQSGFPSNLAHPHPHAHNVFDGGSVCEHCRMGFRAGPVVHLDPRWKDPCAECNYIPHHHPDARREQHYVADANANGMSVSFSNGNFYDPVPYEDARYLRPEAGGEMFHVQQPGAGSPQAHFSGFEDMGARYGNRPPAYAADNLYQVAQNLPPIQSIRRKAQVPMRPGTSYESSGLMVPNGGFTRSPSPQDVSPRMSRMAMESQIQNSWAGQNGSASQKVQGFEGAGAEYFYDHGSRSNRNVGVVAPDHVQHGVMYAEVPYEGVPLAPTMVDDKFMASTAFGYHPFAKMNGADVAPQICVEKNTVVEAQQEDIGKEDDMQASPLLSELKNLHVDVNKLKPADGNCNSPKVVIADANATAEQGGMSAECLSILPDLIASVKKAALETAEVVKARAEANADEDVSAIPEKKEASKHELEPEASNAVPDLVSDSDRDGEHQKIPKIESTTAESEALAKGLQTIRNDDLEEIRQLGSGTYGSVFHGKWKGSDVAIKRIKASCFAGRPSERERLIADFWKEALILSSLHHPNVVSFYGVVRDGPDGSLATVTEFMVNGSLKQFLQKKDRTIDRRKRLIIAMDAAFGMEYLHGKNIVHFDLKCENLLVNMRDPHRPICKIGDLGLSKVKQHTLVSGGVRGTLPWMAPELLSGKCHMVTEKIDVYSFGIVMWELLTGEDPYADMHCASMIGGIVNNTLRPQIPTWCDPEWKALMESCWSSEPGERPSFAEISQKLRKMAAAINLK